MDAINQYYVEERDNLVRRITFRAGSPENAEDIVQEAFARALKYWKSAPPNGPIANWFSGLLNNALRDFKRDERLYGMCDEFEEEEHDGLEMDLLHHDIQRKIRQDMVNGNDTQRVVLDLYFNKMYNVRDIVKVTDLENKTVRMCVWRFKEECKAKYAIGG